MLAREEYKGEPWCQKQEAKEEKSSSSSKAEKSSSAQPVKTGEIKEMVVPSVGESITEVTISSWLKEDGDFVELDEIIAEVESDKATFELPAEANRVFHYSILKVWILKSVHILIFLSCSNFCTGETSYFGLIYLKNNKFAKFVCFKWLIYLKDLVL